MRKQMKELAFALWVIEQREARAELIDIRIFKIEVRAQKSCGKLTFGKECNGFKMHSNNIFFL